MPLPKELFNAPNLVSLLRLLMAPLLIWLALQHQTKLFFLALGFAVFTDLLDGFLARTLHQITTLGSRLDSWGDFTIYSTMAVCAWIQWPEMVIEYRYSCLAIVLSFIIPTLIGLIKFRSLTSYHTWSVKAAVAATVIGYVLHFAGITSWPFIVAACLCAVAAIEETAISLILKHNLNDIRTVKQALRLSHRKI